jgi:hypothetical protein
MAFLDELNTSTQVHIVPGVVDNNFKNDPTLAYLRKNNIERFPGGRQIQENLIYGSLPGGSYAQGDTFPVTIEQIETGATFDPKLYQTTVAISKEQIQIFNKGPQMVFRIIDSRLQAAALSMSARLAIAAYQQGQTGTRTLDLNGFAEQLNDGTNNSFDGASYSTYGTLTRGGTIGSALTSPMTNPTAQISGPITYKLLEEAYNSVVIGDEYPNLMVTTNLGMSYIKEKFQPQWRVETQDPNIGFNGVKFNMAMIIQSQYAPGTAGVNDTKLGNYLVSTGETLFYLNTKYLRFWVTDDPEFGFGFSGFKPAQDTSIVAGQYFFAGNITNQSPRLMRHLYDITG